MRENVLVVDDDERNRTLLRCWLEPSCEVTEAADGAAALASLDLRTPDLVLLDVMMPGLDGFEVCREIKRRSADGAFVPVLLLTALTDQAHRNEGLRAGADDFVSKPCDRTELTLRVRAFLRTRRQDVALRRQHEALLELSALKEDLVTLVAHDLRNPLSALASLLTAARGAARDPELRADLDASLVAAARVRETAEDLLEVRLVEERGPTVHRERVSLEELVRRTVAAYEPVARARGVSFPVSVDGDPALAVDARLVGRAIENLVSNALRYAPDGTVVTIAIRRAGTAAEIEVADRGPGVSRTLRPVLFEKFGGVEARCGNARRGYGLGLYLVKLVAQAHGGGVSVHDRSGGGAAFRLRLEDDRAVP